MDEGVLEGWRGEGGIHDEESAARVGFLGICSDIEGCAFGIDGSFEEDNVSGGEILSRAVEGEFLEAADAGEEGDYAMAAMVTFSDGDAARV